MAEPSLKASDLLAVRSRVSWGAIAAGAMVSLAVFVLLTLLGVALGIEVAVRGTDVNLGFGAAIYSILTLALAMFFGGWATSRLAVGESKLEAILYGVILWGLLFTGLLVAGLLRRPDRLQRRRGRATGAYTVDEGAGGAAAAARPVAVEDLTKMGLDQEQAQKVRDFVEQTRTDPAATIRDVAAQPEVQQASRQAAWWSLIGVVHLDGDGDPRVPDRLGRPARAGPDPRRAAGRRRTTPGPCSRSPPQVAPRRPAARGDPILALRLPHPPLPPDLAIEGLPTWPPAAAPSGWIIRSSSRS